MIITIDGPSGTGKSTTAKLLSDQLNFHHLDTGAFYRAFACHVDEEGVNPDQEEAVYRCLSSFQFDLTSEKEKKRYFLGKEEITEKMRLPQISRLSSQISVYPRVRKAIVSLQREYASQKNIVAEGRDLGTVVFPKADLKFFLIAENRVRAERRYAEMVQKKLVEPGEAQFQKTLEDLIERDARDQQREASPLICPEDAFILDTTDQTVDQVVKAMLKIIEHQKESRFSIKKILKIGFYQTIIWSFRLIFSLFYRVKVYGQKNIQEAGGIIASNHVSFFDPPLLACTAKVRVHFLARESLFRIPIFKNVIRLLNAHPIKGGIGDLSVIRLVGRLIQKKEKIIMFPEGTRSEDGELRPLKKGVANIILRTGSTVYPAYIEGAYSIWSKDRKLPKLFGCVTIVYGKPIQAAKYALLEKKEAQEILTRDLEQKLQSLKKWLLSGAQGSIP